MEEQIKKVETVTEYATEHPQPAAADGLTVTTAVTLPEVEAADKDEQLASETEQPEGK